MKRIFMIVLAVAWLLAGCASEETEETKALAETVSTVQTEITEEESEVNTVILLETELAGVDYGLTAVNPYGQFVEDVIINVQGAEALVKWLLGQTQLEAMAGELFSVSEEAPVYSGWIGTASDATREIRLLTTVNMKEVGALDQILPQFTEEYGYQVTVIGAEDPYAEAVAGAGDLVLAELPGNDLYEESGYFRKVAGMQQLHIPLVTCPYVLCGPAEDPAAAGKQGSLEDALAAIERETCYFVHWSGHTLWENTPTGAWYFPADTQAGPALTIAEELGGYVISDKLTYAVFHSLKGIIS